MTKIIDQRQERGIRFSEVGKGQTFWVPSFLRFMLKIEECDYDDGIINAVSLPEGDIYELEPGEIVEPCHAEIRIFH